MSCKIYCSLTSNIAKEFTPSVMTIEFGGTDSLMETLYSAEIVFGGTGEEAI